MSPFFMLSFLYVVSDVEFFIEDLSLSQLIGSFLAVLVIYLGRVIGVKFQSNRRNRKS